METFGGIFFLFDEAALVPFCCVVPSAKEGVSDQMRFEVRPALLVTRAKCERPSQQSNVVQNVGQGAGTKCRRVLQSCLLLISSCPDVSILRALIVTQKSPFFVDFLPSHAHFRHF